MSGTPLLPSATPSSKLLDVSSGRLVFPVNFPLHGTVALTPTCLAAVVAGHAVLFRFCYGGRHSRATPSDLSCLVA